MMIITKYSFWASECENYFQIKWYHAETQMHVIEENLMKCHFIYEGGFFPELILHIHSPVVVFWFQCKHIFVETFWGGGGGVCVWNFAFLFLCQWWKEKTSWEKIVLVQCYNFVASFLWSLLSEGLESIICVLTA